MVPSHNFIFSSTSPLPPTTLLIDRPSSVGRQYPHNLFSVSLQMLALKFECLLRVKGDAIYSATVLIKDMGIFPNPVEQSLRMFLLFLVLPHCFFVVA